MGVDVITTVKGRQKSPKTSIQVEVPPHVVEEVRAAVQSALKSIVAATGQTTLDLDGNGEGPSSKTKRKTSVHVVEGNGVVRTKSDT